MMKWTFACAAVVAGLLADQAPAQEPATIPATVTNSSEIMTPAPRVGLFGRLRERRGMTTTVNQPIVQAQAIEPQPVVQAQAIQPQPIAAQQTPSGVQQAQYSEKVAMPATPAMSATAMPATAMPAQMQVVETRQGLLARLRARRGQ